MFQLWRERPLLQGMCLSLRKRRSQEKRNGGEGEQGGSGQGSG